MQGTEKSALDIGNSMCKTLGVTESMAPLEERNDFGLMNRTLRMKQEVVGAVTRELRWIRSMKSLNLILFGDLEWPGEWEALL